MTNMLVIEDSSYECSLQRTCPRGFWGNMRDKNGRKKMQQPLYCSYFVAKDYFAMLESEESNDWLNAR